MRLLACLIVAPQRGYDEPAILSYPISSFCPTSADGLHTAANRALFDHRVSATSVSIMSFMDDFANGPGARSRPRRGQSRGGYPPGGNGALSPSLRSGSTRRGNVPAACRPESNLDPH